jgi:hypothetical protein
MTAPFQKREETTDRNTEELTKSGGGSIPRIAVVKSLAIARHANVSPLDPARPPDRKLRNRLILANAIAWIVIIFVIRLIFF